MIQKRIGAPASRKWNENNFVVNQTPTSAINIPLIVSGQLTANMLTETLHQPVHYLAQPQISDWKPFFAGNRDTLLRQMLQQSDNFLAEQFALMVSSLQDSQQHTMSVDRLIPTIVTKDFVDAPQKPKWVDGSGLSRYNLMTPQFMVYVLKKIRTEYLLKGKSEAYLCSLLAQAGVSGTVQHEVAYPASTFAKTGSLSNNHTISGFLRSKSGKTFVFSIMMNHYLEKSDQIRMQIAKILQQLNNR